MHGLYANTMSCVSTSSPKKNGPLLVQTGRLRKVNACATVSARWQIAIALSKSFSYFAIYHNLFMQPALVGFVRRG